MNSKSIAAIDPGTGGSIVFWYPTGELDYFTMMDLQSGILSRLQDFKRFAAEKESEPISVIEKPPPYAGKNTPSSRIAVLFENFGFIKGVIAALEIPLEEIPPKVWQADYADRPRSANYSQWKTILADIARTKWPSQRVTLKVSDALLLLHWKLRRRGIKDPGQINPAGALQPELAIS